MEGSSCSQDSAAHRVWHSAYTALCGEGHDEGERAWQRIVSTSSSDNIWHTLQNCVAYQAQVWQNLLDKGLQDATHPAAFKMAIILRHTPIDVAKELLSSVLNGHSQAQELTAYILALISEEDITEESPFPARDAQLFGDCELAALAGPADRYAAHAQLVRREYPQMGDREYKDLRIKILNQFSRIPKLFHTPEFEDLEGAARENISKEISTLKQQ